MSRQSVIRVVFLMFSLFSLICSGTKDEHPALGRVKVQDSGNAVVTAVSPSGKAIVGIRTSVIEGGCQKACPTTAFLSEAGSERASVVRRLSLSIAGEPIGVPPFVYSGLFNIQWASLEYRGSNFDLALSEGPHEYLVHIYFDARDGITRMTIYDEQAAQMVEDATIHQAVFE
jgi:hypothetical protein